MKTYEKIKKLGRMYVAPVVFGTSLLLGGFACSNPDLPVNERVKQQIIQVQDQEFKRNYQTADSLENEIRQGYVLLDSLFNASIVDGHFDLKEQNQMYGMLVNMRGKIKCYNEYVQKKDLGRYGLRLSKDYNYLSKNIEGIREDGPPSIPFLKSSLKNQLKKQYGLDIIVDASPTADIARGVEYVLIGAAGVGVTLILSILGSMIPSKKKN